MPAALTIEQLAADSGMTVRNIRAHQARGLLSPPAVRRRVGYYGPEHVAQLKLIRDLQDEGFNLAGIKRLLADRRGTAQRLVHSRHASADDRSQVPIPSPAQLAEQFVARGVSLDGALAVFEQIEDNCDAVSMAFVSLFTRDVWEPFQREGMPVARREEIEESIERLRPLATDSLLAIFGQRMGAQIEAAFGQLGLRLSTDGGDRGDED